MVLLLITLRLNPYKVFIMALQKTITISGQGSVFNGESSIPVGNISKDIDAYIKVLTVSGSKEELNIAVLFSDHSVNFRQNYNFTPDLDGHNFIKQAYLHLKTLPEFGGAIDC